MNSHGLCVLANTLLVPDNRFWDGVPTLAATRELLTKGTQAEAVAYIRSIPLAIPLNFVLAQPRYGVVNLEASHVEVVAYEPTRRSAPSIESATTASRRASSAERNCPCRQSPRSRGRRFSRRTYAKRGQNAAPMDLQWLKDTMLKASINYSFVIGTILMEPMEGRMHVRFGMPTVARGKKREGGEAGSLERGISDWHMMETAKSLLPPYDTYELLK